MKWLFIPILTLLCSFVEAQSLSSMDTLQWRSSRPLTWEDFKGEPIDGIGLTGEVFCMNIANFERANAFQKVRFKVFPIFDRPKSWINNDMKSADALRYFQVIFNLYEVHARHLRKELSVTKFGADPNPVFQEKYNTSMALLMEEFNQFRKDTKMGVDKNALIAWETKVDGELKSLEAFLK